MKGRNAAFGGVLGLVLVCLAHAPVHAQDPLEEESPRVEKLTFRGAHNIKAEMLRDSIVTQATRCRGLLLRPLCWVSGSPFFVEYHDLDRAELARDELRIRVIYFRHGYRSAQVSSSLARASDEGVAVTFDIVEGPPTRVGTLAVRQTDSVLGPRQLRQARIPQPGELYDLNHLDSAKIRLRGMLWDRAHGNAEVLDSARIDPDTHLAALQVLLQAGPHTTIDSIAIEGNENVSDRTVGRILGLREGQLYRRGDMNAAQRRLYETELFRQSLVRVPDVVDSAKTVQVIVREAPLRAVSLGAGFNSTEFVQGEARFTRYNLWGGARRLDVRAAVGNLLAPQLYGKTLIGTSAVPFGIGRDVDPAFLRPTWQIGVDLKEPFVLSAKASLGVGVSTHRRIIPGIVIDRGAAVNGSFTWRFADRVPGSLTYQYEQSRVAAGDLYFCINFGVCGLRTIAALRTSHQLSPLAITAHAERADDALAPTRGYIARLDVEHASSLTLSDWRYNRVAAEYNRYFPRGRSVFAAHVRAGWVYPLASTPGAIGVGEAAVGLLHPRKRFYAGGARSVRGYAENQLGPRVLTIDPIKLIEPADSSGAPPCTYATVADGTCDPNIAPSSAFVPRPLGGNTLLEGSVEYRFPLGRTLTGAMFVDAGTIYGQRLNLPPGNRAAITPGVGIRYSSPIGPVRVDLAIRPGLGEDMPVVTQIMGADSVLHLVQLKTPKHYSPIENRGNFLRQITSRLQLHLAIGEAW